MTINDFWKELNEREDLSRLRISFEHYSWVFHRDHNRFLTVGIDLFQWILQHSSVEQTIARLPSDKDDIFTIVSGIASKIRYLQSLPINFVIVIDGTIKNDKLRHMEGRREQDDDLVFEEQYTLAQQKIASKEYIMKGALITKITGFLKAANIDYIFATGDAEIELARLNHLGIIDAIISNDADSFAYGAKLVLRNFSKNKSDNPQTGKGKDQTSNFHVTAVNLDTLKKHGLGTDEIMFLALCQGDDYTNGMHSLGIKKAWSLATKKIPSFDVVKELKQIYSCKSNNQTTGLLQLSFNERIEKLKNYEDKLNNLLATNAPELFGHKHNLKVTLPSDFVFASHFYPYFTSQIFVESMFSGNQNNYRRNYTLNLNGLVEWERYGLDKTLPCCIIRENDLHPKIGRTFIDSDKNTRNDFPSRPDSLDWFSKLKYMEILDCSRTTRNKLSGYEYLVDELGKCFVWKAIVCFQDLGLGNGDIFIKSEKEENVEFDNKSYKFKKYQVMIRKRQIFKRYVQLKLFDDDLNPIEEKLDFVWMPDFIFKEHISAKNILNRYISSRSPPKKRSPKKAKIPPQTSNLDFLSKSPKSPFKMTIKTQDALDLTGARTVSLKHPNEEDPLMSPHKKSRSEESIPLTEIKAGDSSFSYAFDAETSRVMGTDNIDDIPEEPTSITTKDLLANLADADTHGNEKETTREKKTDFNTMFGHAHINQKKQHERLAVNRGPSNFDVATQLPSVPTVNEHEDHYLEKFMNGSSSRDLNNDGPGDFWGKSFSEDSFTDTDGDIEVYLNKLDAKPRQDDQRMVVEIGDETILSEDTFSDDLDVSEILEVVEANKAGQDKKIKDTTFLDISSSYDSNFKPMMADSGSPEEIKPKPEIDNSHDAFSYDSEIAMNDTLGGKLLDVEAERLAVEDTQDQIVIDLTVDSDGENDDLIYNTTFLEDTSATMMAYQYLARNHSDDGMILAEDTDDEELYVKK